MNSNSRDIYNNTTDVKIPLKKTMNYHTDITINNTTSKSRKNKTTQKNKYFRMTEISVIILMTTIAKIHSSRNAIYGETINTTSVFMCMFNLR